MTCLALEFSYPNIIYKKFKVHLFAHKFIKIIWTEANHWNSNLIFFFLSKTKVKREISLNNLKKFFHGNYY